MTDDNPNQPGISSHSRVPESRLGFSNIELDNGVVRRHLLFINPDLNNPCPTSFSFSFQLASKYLNSKGIKPEEIDSDRIKIGETIIQRLQSNTGAYHQLDNRGFQLLLNYRNSEKIAATVSFNDVLENKFNPELIKERIVIIGVVAPISNPTDYFSTPYSKGVLPQMSGVDIQAQMTSQILSAVLDKRPLLWSLSETAEGFWIVIWSLTGSGIAIIFLRNINSFLLFLYTVICISILSLICFVFLLQGTWIPLVSSAISLSISSLSGWLLIKHWSQILTLKILQSRNNT